MTELTARAELPDVNEQPHISHNQQHVQFNGAVGSPLNTNSGRSPKDRSPNSKRQATKAAHSLASAFERHVVHNEQQLDRELQSAINDIRRSDAAANRAAALADVREKRHNHNEDRLGKAALRHHSQANERIANTEAKLAMKEDRYLKHVGISHSHAPNALLMDETTTPTKTQAVTNNSLHRSLLPMASITPQKAMLQGGHRHQVGRLPPLLHSTSPTHATDSTTTSKDMNSSSPNRSYLSRAHPTDPGSPGGEVDSPTSNRDPAVLDAIQQRLPKGRQLHCLAERNDGRKVEALTRHNMARQVKDKERTAKGPPLSELIQGKVAPVGYSTSGGRGPSGTGEGVSMVRKPSPQRELTSKVALAQRPASRSEQERDDRRKAIMAMLLRTPTTTTATTTVPTTSIPTFEPGQQIEDTTQITKPASDVPVEQPALTANESSRPSVGSRSALRSDQAQGGPATKLPSTASTANSRRYSASSSYTSASTSRTHTASRELPTGKSEAAVEVAGLLSGTPPRSQPDPVVVTATTNARVNKETELRFFDDEERFSNNGYGGDSGFESSSTDEGDEGEQEKKADLHPSTVDPSVEKGGGGVSPKRASIANKSPSPHKGTKISTGVLPKRGLPMYGQRNSSLVPRVRPGAAGKKQSSLPSLRQSSTVMKPHHSDGVAPSPLLKPVKQPPRRLEALKVHAGGGQLKVLLPAQTYPAPSKAHGSPAKNRSPSPSERLPVRNTNPATMAHAWMTKATARTTRIVAHDDEETIPAERGAHLDEAKRGALLWLHAHPNVASSPLKALPPKLKAIEAAKVASRQVSGAEGAKASEKVQPLPPDSAQASSSALVLVDTEELVAVGISVRSIVQATANALDTAAALATEQFLAKRQSVAARCIQTWWRTVKAIVVATRAGDERRAYFDFIVASEAAEAIARFFRSVVMPKRRAERRRAVAFSAARRAVSSGEEEYYASHQAEEPSDSLSLPSTSHSARPNYVVGSVIDNAVNMRSLRYDLSPSPSSSPHVASPRQDLSPPSSAHSQVRPERVAMAVITGALQSRMALLSETGDSIV